MKSQWLLLTLLPVLFLTLVGCGKSGSASVDVSPVEKSFASADDAIKAAAAKAVEAVKSADYNAAVAELLKLAGDPKLTDSQKKAVANVLDQLKTAVADDNRKALDDAKKTLGQ